MNGNFITIITALIGMLGTVIASMFTVKKKSQELEMKNELRFQYLENVIKELKNDRKVIEEVMDRLLNIEKMMVGFKKDLEYLKGEKIE